MAPLIFNKGTEMSLEEQLRKSREAQWDKAMKMAKEELEFLIMATPTGVVREHLTTANIELGWAEKLEKTLREGDTK